MIGDEGVDRLLRPDRADAICQIEGSCDFSTEAVDVEGNAADRRIGKRRLQLSRDPLVGGQAGGLPDPRAAMHQRACDFDDGDPFDDCEGLAAVPRLAIGQIISEE